MHSGVCLQGKDAVLAKKVHPNLNNAKEPAMWRSEEGGLQREDPAGAKVLRQGWVYVLETSVGSKEHLKRE